MDKVVTVHIFIIAQVSCKCGLFASFLTSKAIFFRALKTTKSQCLMANKGRGWCQIRAGFERKKAPGLGAFWAWLLLFDVNCADLVLRLKSIGSFLVFNTRFSNFPAQFNHVFDRFDLGFSCN